jgi:hypothetical protein
MLRSSRNAQYRLPPRTSSLGKHVRTPRRRSQLRRAAAIVASVVFVCILITLFRVHGQVDKGLDALRRVFPHHEQVEEDVPTYYDPHLQRADLAADLAISPEDSSVIVVTITNFHPQTTVDLLVWDSPHDTDAFLRCVFDVTDVETGLAVPCTPRQVLRERPPKAVDFIEIPPMHAVERSIVIPTNGQGSLKLQKGKEYDFQVKKRFKGVWKANVRIVDKQYLGKTGGGSGMVDWEYESNVLRVDASG